jgi:glycosyltransferase involved in cell wall biosynthesis
MVLLRSEVDIRVSVIIPTLNNRELYLDCAVRSVAQQLYKPIEIIVVNNGEDTELDAGRWESLGIPILISSTVRMCGVSQARNIGATIARGTLLAFLDDDDLWPPNYLLSMVTLINRDCLKACVSKISLLEADRVRTFFDATGLMQKDLLMIANPGITGSNTVIEKGFFLKIGGYDPELTTGEDSDLALRILQTGEPLPVNISTSIVLRSHSGERLTSSSNLAMGYFKLYNKYKNEVSLRNRIYLFWRYTNEGAKNHFTIFSKTSYFFLSGLVVLLRRMPRNIYKFPRHIQVWDSLEEFLEDFSK